MGAMGPSRQPSELMTPGGGGGESGNAPAQAWLVPRHSAGSAVAAPGAVAHETVSAFQVGAGAPPWDSTQHLPQQQLAQASTLPGVWGGVGGEWVTPGTQVLGPTQPTTSGLEVAASAPAPGPTAWLASAPEQGGEPGGDRDVGLGGGRGGGRGSNGGGSAPGAASRVTANSLSFDIGSSDPPAGLTGDPALLPILPPPPLPPPAGLVWGSASASGLPPLAPRVEGGSMLPLAPPPGLALAPPLGLALAPPPGLTLVPSLTRVTSFTSVAESGAGGSQSSPDTAPEVGQCISQRFNVGPAY